MSDQETRVCTHCREAKPLSEYFPDRRNRDGLNSWCKVCKRANQNAWRRAHPEKDAAWREANPERLREIRRKSHEKHRERKRQHDRLYRARVRRREQYDKLHRNAGWRRCRINFLTLKVSALESKVERFRVAGVDELREGAIPSFRDVTEKACRMLMGDLEALLALDRRYRELRKEFEPETAVRRKAA